MCKSCMSSLFSRGGKLSKLEIAEKQLYIEVENSISDIVIDYRKRLAELRYNDNSTRKY